MPNPLPNSQTEIAKREIPATLKQIRFTGGLRYNESKQLYREIEPGMPDYTGLPTPEVDAAWHKLVSSTYAGHEMDSSALVKS